MHAAATVFAGAAVSVAAYRLAVEETFPIAHFAKNNGGSQHWTLPCLRGWHVIPLGSRFLDGGIQGPEGRIVCILALTRAIAYHLSRE